MVYEQLKKRPQKKNSMSQVPQCKINQKGNAHKTGTYIHLNDGSSLYKKDNLGPGNESGTGIIQRKVYIGDISEKEPVTYEDLEMRIKSLLPQIKSQFNIEGAEYLLYVKELADSPDPPPLLESFGGEYTLAIFDGLKEVNVGVGKGVVSYEEAYEKVIGCFPDIDTFIQYVAFYPQIKERYGVVDYDYEPKIIDQHMFSALGAYLRYPTIYTYGKTKDTQKISADKDQGPHTLAHVSVDYLMTKAPDSYDFYLQIPDPNVVYNILIELGVNMSENNKAQRYLYDYTSKYTNCISEKDRGAAIARELMEMHPMAVYGWLSNIKEGPDHQGRSVSGTSLAGKGEKYGPELSLDSGWRIGIAMRDLPSHPRTKQMAEYLRLRLSMAVDEQYIPDIVESLIVNGTYELKPEQLLDPGKFYAVSPE